MTWTPADTVIEHYQAVVNELNKEIEEYEDELNHLTCSYRGRMYLLIEDTKNENYMKEHYQESPFYNRTNAKDMIDTLIWMSYSDEEKKKILDGEMDVLNP